MSEARHTLRKPIWITLLLAALASATSYGAAQMLEQLGRDPIALMAAGVAFLLIIATLDALIARVSMRGDEISIMRGLRYRRFYRGHIASVRWKAGKGVSLELDDGLLVDLPELGRGPARAQTIRRWLEEGRVGEEVPGSDDSEAEGDFSVEAPSASPGDAESRSASPDERTGS